MTSFSKNIKFRHYLLSVHILSNLRCWAFWRNFAGMKHKALFFDIDGTLVSFNTHRIPASTINALRAAHSAGHSIFISTGRPYVLINNLMQLQELNIIDGYITMNGAYCFVNDEVVYKSPIPAADVAQISHFCQQSGDACVFVSEHDIKVCQADDMLRKIFYEYLGANPIEEVDFKTAANAEIYQLTPFITAEQELQLMSQIGGCECARWYPAFADITAKGNTKQRGIDEFVRHLKLNLADTIAFGDGGNDISMLRHAAIGVAMGQASDEVKAAADMVTTSVDDNGIANAMQKLGLI